MVRNWIIVVCGLGLATAGCNAGSGTSGDASGRSGKAGQAACTTGVAVVDLDEVAKQLGKDVAMVTAVRQGQASLNQQLQTFQANLQQKYKQQVEALGDEQPASQADQQARQKKLVEMERQFKLELNQAARSAQNELKAHEQRLVQSFRAEVKPVAQQVAAERGLGVVVTKNDSVLLTFDDGHDITAAVVAKLRATQPAAPPERTATATSRPTPPATQQR